MFTLTNDDIISMFDDIENSPRNKIIMPKGINLFMVRGTNCLSSRYQK